MMVAAVTAARRIDRSRSPVLVEQNVEFIHDTADHLDNGAFSGSVDTPGTVQLILGTGTRTGIFLGVRFAQAFLSFTFRSLNRPLYISCDGRCNSWRLSDVQ